MTSCREDWLDRREALTTDERQELMRHAAECPVCALETELPLRVEKASRSIDRDRIARAVDGAMRARTVSARRIAPRRLRALALLAAALLAAGVAAAAMEMHRRARVQTPIPANAASVETVVEAPPPATTVAATTTNLPIEVSAAAPDPSNHAPPENASKLFERANRLRQAGDVEGAIGVYRRLDEQYPTSNEAGVSHVSLARLLERRGDTSGALVEYDRYLHDRTRIDLREEALIGRARACRKLARGDEREAWETLLREYPSSMYATQARERLDALR